MSGPVKDEQHGHMAVSGLDQIAADDLLLDALARGSAPDDDDAAAVMLAAWRAELSEGVPDAAPIAPDRSRQRRLTRMVLGAAAAAVVAAGLAVSAHQADPSSPLWPVSKVIYPQRSEVVAAEEAIADAREAAAAERDDEARRLLAVASAHVARIDERAVADRLRAEIDSILRSLAAVAPAETPAPSTPQAPAPSPSAPAGAPPPSGGSTPAPTPSPSRSGGLLPDLPLPTPLLPLPPLPSILPG